MTKYIRDPRFDHPVAIDEPTVPSRLKETIEITRGIWIGLGYVYRANQEELNMLFWVGIAILVAWMLVICGI